MDAIQRLELDFEKSSPFTEWDFVDVVFPAADMEVTVRHNVKGKGDLVVVAVGWRFLEPPTTPPAIYTLLSSGPRQDGYVRVRSTVQGYATVLIALRRDS